MEKSEKPSRKFVKKEVVAVRISGKVKLKIIAISEKEGKSLSGYLTSLIEEDLRKNH